MQYLRKMIGVAALSAASLAMAGHVSANDDLTIIPFGTVGYWQVLSVHEANGRLDHCMATVEYGSGKRVSFNARAAGGWGFQIHDPAWPSRDEPASSAAAELSKAATMGERVERVGDAIWIHFAGGVARSKLASPLLDRPRKHRCPAL